jgi:hypothetical protein
MSTCQTVIIPTANALGYSQGKREEAGVDPNHNFPFDVKLADSNNCMQTIAKWSINKLFRSHLFPVGLMFHKGMEVVTYEWGDPMYLSRDTLDSVVQRDIALVYSRYANGFMEHAPYDYGTMNDKVYYVRGGWSTGGLRGAGIPTGSSSACPGPSGGTPQEDQVQLALLIWRRQQRRRYVERILSDDKKNGVSVGPYSDDPTEDADARVVT